MQHYHIKHNLIIHALPAVVFKAISTAAGIARWWTPQSSMKAELGSTGDIDFGSSYHNEMEVVALETDRKLSWLVRVGDPQWVGTEMVFELEARDGETFLRFGHNNWAGQTEFFAHCNYNWGYYLTSLKAFCETGKGQPFKPE